jgi:hypothetical protein
VIEKPLPQPATIEEDFNAHYGDAAPAAPSRRRPSEKGLTNDQETRTHRSLPLALSAGAAMAAGEDGP